MPRLVWIVSLVPLAVGGFLAVMATPPPPSEPPRGIVLLGLKHDPPLDAQASVWARFYPARGAFKPQPVERDGTRLLLDVKINSRAQWKGSPPVLQVFICGGIGKRVNFRARPRDTEDMHNLDDDGPGLVSGGLLPSDVNDCRFASVPLHDVSGHWFMLTMDIDLPQLWSRSGDQAIVALPGIASVARPRSGDDDADQRIGGVVARPLPADAYLDIGTPKPYSGLVVESSSPQLDDVEILSWKSQLDGSQEQSRYFIARGSIPSDTRWRQLLLFLAGIFVGIAGNALLLLLPIGQKETPSPTNVAVRTRGKVSPSPERLQRRRFWALRRSRRDRGAIASAARSIRRR